VAQGLPGREASHADCDTSCSDLLAPCESGAQGLINILYILQYHKAHKLSGAKKELRSGSLVPPLADARSAVANN
jgi:hypothetical protein